VDNYWMDSVHPGEVVLVERRQQLKHGAQTSGVTSTLLAPRRGPAML
jgi:hypothetical protein